MGNYDGLLMCLAVGVAMVLIVQAGDHLRYVYRCHRCTKMDAWQRRALMEDDPRRGFEVLRSDQEQSARLDNAPASCSNPLHGRDEDGDS